MYYKSANFALLIGFLLYKKTKKLQNLHFCSKQNEPDYF